MVIPVRSTAGNYGHTYLIRGIATEGRGIFPVVESRILDTELKLRQQEVMSVHTYKQAIQSFIHNTAGVRYEE